MQFTTIEENGTKVAVVTGDKKIITDTQSALDLLATVNPARTVYLMRWRRG